MKDFEVLRYFKKWWVLIAATSIFAGIFFMRYARNNQTYTAHSIIKYAYPKAEEGLAPDGSKLDVAGIFSTTVVKETLEELDIEVGVDAIRSAATVTEIIPEDIQKSQDAKIEDGRDYEEYYPVEYNVNFVANSQQGPEFARAILDSILSNYFVEFGEKYVSKSTIPNNAENVLGGGYDYIEQAELINNSVKDILSQLGERQAASPNFCSARTGLTLSELFEEYKYISNVKIPYLFSEILDKKLTQNKDVLIKKYKERIVNYGLSSDTDQNKVDSVLEIIESYSNKNKEDSLYYNKSSEGQDGTLRGNILAEVYEDVDIDGNGPEDTIVDRTTVYDQLIADYVTLENNKSHTIIEAAYCQYIIDTFEEEQKYTGDTTEAQTLVENNIKEIVEELKELYKKLEITMDEYNEYLGSQNLQILSSTSVSESVNVKLYMILGMVVFFGVGCVGAVILGRFGDFTEFFFYTDTKLRMPNRNACDNFIKNHSEKILKNSYACVVMELTNLYQINSSLGRTVGDVLLQDFAKMAQNAAASYGKIYYNGGQQFIGFFEKCSAEDVEDCCDFMRRLVKGYNEENTSQKIECTLGYSESKKDNVYTIRGLLQTALKSRTKQEV